MTTVRSQEKAHKIKEAYPNTPKSKLDFAIVEDIAHEGAFDNAVVSDPPFEAVIHTASPVRLCVSYEVATLIARSSTSMLTMSKRISWTQQSLARLARHPAI